MQQIRKDVQRKLFVTPVTEHRRGKPNSMGDRNPDEDVSYKGYLVEGFERILNRQGEEAISGTQIYLTGPDAVAIQNDSTISCEAHKKQMILSKKVWRGQGGVPVIGVLYLP